MLAGVASALAPVCVEVVVAGELVRVIVSAAAPAVPLDEDRGALAVLAAFVPHTRPVGCWLSRPLITPSMCEPAPIGPGG